MQVTSAPRYVTVGFDGSPNSAEALRRGAAEALERRARLDIVRVIPEARGVLRGPAAWLRLHDEVARFVPPRHHVPARLRVARGDPGAELTRLSDRAEVLVIGARPSSRHGAFRESGTVLKILSSARCEVIVCADGADGADGGG